MAQRVLGVVGAVAATFGLQLLVSFAFLRAQNSMLFLIGSLVAFVIPWPIALLTLRRGMAAGTVALGGCALFLGALGSGVICMAYLAQYGAASVLVPILMMKGLNWDRTVCLGTGASAGVGMLALGLHSLSQGLPSIEVADHWARGYVEQALTALGSSGLPADTVEKTRQSLAALGDGFVLLYPAVAVFSVALILLVMVLFLTHQGRDRLAGQVPFGDWKCPEGLVWALIASGAGLLLLHGGLYRLAANGLVLVLGIYLLQGLAILRYFFTLKGVPPLLQALGYFLVVASAPLLVLATGVGVFDLWIDFRKPRNPKD